MSKHYRITLRVSYKDGSVPSNMEAQLRSSFLKSILKSTISRIAPRAIVETWSMDVEEFGHRRHPQFIDD